MVLNNPSGHLRIDFWVYVVHLIALRHPRCPRRFVIETDIDFRFSGVHLKVLWSPCPCVIQTQSQRSSDNNSVSVSDTKTW